MMTLKKQAKVIKNRNMVDTKKEKKSLIFTGIDAQSLFSEKLKLYIKTMLFYCFKCIKKS